MQKALLYKSVAISLVAALLLTAASPVVAMALPDPIAPTDHNNSVTATETQDALQDVPGILNSSDQVAATTDGDSAMVATAAGTTVDMPKDPEQGVSFGATTGPKLDVQLPNADIAGVAKQVAPGVVAYDSGNGSASAVQANQDGSVRMLTVIDNPNAPTTYDYKVTVPNGGHIELTPDGGALVLDANGQPLSSVSAPWAKDAVGKQIRTWFSTDGQTLTQHVRHNVRGVVYPVTADPRFDWHWYGVNIYIEQYNVNRILAVMASGGGVMAIGVAVTGGTGAPAAAVGGAVIAIGSGAIGWCSSKGRGMWLHVHWGMTWCNNG